MAWCGLAFAGRPGLLLLDESTRLSAHASPMHAMPTVREATQHYMQAGDHTNHKFECPCVCAHASTDILMHGRALSGRQFRRSVLAHADMRRPNRKMHNSCVQTAVNTTSKCYTKADTVRCLDILVRRSAPCHKHSTVAKHCP